MILDYHDKFDLFKYKLFRILTFKNCLRELVSCLQSQQRSLQPSLKAPGLVNLSVLTQAPN